MDDDSAREAIYRSELFYNYNQETSCFKSFSVKREIYKNLTYNQYHFVCDKLNTIEKVQHSGSSLIE